MKKHFGIVFFALILLSLTIVSWKSADKTTSNFIFNTDGSTREMFGKYISDIYTIAHLQEAGVDTAVFRKALTGFINLKLANKLPQNSSILTIVDLARSSCEKRMWIIDLALKEVLLNTWVAHGQGSGEDMATQFSDNNDSHQSSLGFYVTDNIYYGKHGISLKLDGMDAGFNANARERAIVVHGAEYVNQGAINSMGHLGRSYGCPAVSSELADQVINIIKNKTVMFINGNDYRYNSKYLDEDLAANYISQNVGEVAIAGL